MKKTAPRKMSLARETLCDLASVRLPAHGNGTDTRFKTCGDCDTVVVICG